MKKKNLLLSSLFAFLLIIIPSKALAITNLTQKDFDDVNEEKGITLSTGDFDIYELESGEYSLDEDIELDSILVIEDEEDVTIDLNGKSIVNASDSENNMTIGVAGKLKLTGKGSIGAIFEEDEEELIDQPIFIGYINNFESLVYSDEGNLIIDGDITFNGNVGSRDGELTINKGIFTEPIVINGGKLVINGGTFNGIIISNDVDVTINDGIFNKNQYNSFFGIGLGDEEEDEKLSDEEIKELNSSPAIMYMSNMRLIIGDLDDLNDEEPTSYGKIVINDGKFSGGMTAAYLFGMKSVEINGGTFDANVDAVVAAADDIKITGGVFTITEKEVYKKVNPNAVRVALGLVGENVEFSGGKFNCDTNGYAIGIQAKDKKVFEESLKEGFIYSDEFEVKKYEYDEEEIEDEEEYILWYSDIQNLMIIPEKGEFKILDGADQTIKNDSDLIVRCSGDIAIFKKLLLDDEEVDKENYELTEGSTIAKLKASYIKTLSEGEHTLTFVYSNGEVKTKFTIESETKNPATGDNISFYIGLLMLSVVSLLGYKVAKKAK